MQRSKSNVLIPLCCIIIAQKTSAATWQQKQRRLALSRTLQLLQQHLPPAPITPFRGGLSAVSDHHNNDSGGSDEDSKYGYVNSNDGDASSVEANSSDNNNHQHASSSSTSLHHAQSNNIKTFKSWTPEDFPDPWTNPLLCGGAATASQLLDQLDTNHTMANSTTQPQQQQLPMKRPLFCDPDQVLDKPTLRAVMTKLREFSQEFASKNFVEGGDFGLWDVDDDEHGQDANHPLASEDVQTSGDNAEEWPNQTTHNMRTRRLRHNNNLLPTNQHRQLSPSSKHGLSDTDTVEVAIALVQKINLPAILRADSYFFYSDQDDMVNDAAQYFARYVHDTWNKRVMQEENTIEGITTNIVLIFISVHDRICYISSGTRIATILPWWRLEHVVQDMKPMLRKGETGHALEVAIEDMTSLLRAGSPTVKDRMDDFFSRFGVVLAFAFFTFMFATYGEFQDRRKRVILAERRSRMNSVEREKARSLQQEFQTKVCPICLETFGGVSSEMGKDDVAIDDDGAKKDQKQKLNRVDSLGIPTKGNDGKPIKYLRCGHIFDETCWKMWVDSGHGNAMMCPVCRQDIGRGKRRARSHHDAGGTTTSNNNDGNNNAGQQSLFLRIMEHAHAATAPATLLRPINNLHTNYSSTSWSSTHPEYEDQLNDASATTSLYSTETTPLI